MHIIIDNNTNFGVTVSYIFWCHIHGQLLVLSIITKRSVSVLNDSVTLYIYGYLFIFTQF